MRKKLILLSVLVMALTVAGCFGGGPSVDREAEAVKVAEVVEKFRTAINAFDIEAIDSVLASNFQLTQRQDGKVLDNGQKSRAKLMEELRDLEADRLSQIEQGYDLKLRWTTLDRVFVNDNTVTFSGLWVTEETIGTLWISESGRIAGSVVKVGDDWKITEMTIDFE